MRLPPETECARVPWVKKFLTDPVVLKRRAVLDSLAEKLRKKQEALSKAMNTINHKLTLLHQKCQHSKWDYGHLYMECAICGYSKSTY